MPDYNAFFLDSPSSVVQLDTLQIAHPSFSQTYWLVRNKSDGLTATLETSVEQEFQFVPFSLTESPIDDTLEYELQIVLGDLSEIMPPEVDRMVAAGTTKTAPSVTFRRFSSDDLSEPMVGPIPLEMVEPTVTFEGMSFSARPRSANRVATGLTYNFVQFPMARGLL